MARPCGAAAPPGWGPYLVSAGATAQRLSLGQVAVGGKSNEITAIPEPLGSLELHGARVAIDAMGRQKEIAAQVVARGGGYALTVKDSQPHLPADIQACFERALGHGFAGLERDVYEARQRGHGRDECRCCTVLYCTGGPATSPSGPA